MALRARGRPIRSTNRGSQVGLSASGYDREEKPLWFLSPATIFISVNAIILIWAGTASADTVSEVTGGLVPPSSTYLLELWLILLGTFTGTILAAFFDRRRPTFASSDPRPDAVARASRLFLGVSLLGYLVWFSLAAVRGLSVPLALSTLQGDFSALSIARQTLAPVAGITTVVALGGVASATLIASKSSLRRVDFFLVTLLALGAGARVFLNAERLALIEFAVPVIFALVYRSRHRLNKAIITSAIVGSALAITLFVAAESIRPSFTLRSGSMTLMDYIQVRLLGYYLSAVTNGEYYEAFVPFKPAPNFTIDAFWSAPLLSEVIDPYSVYGFNSAVNFRSELFQGLNPELNTVATLPALRAELGLVIAIGIGLILGVLLASASRYLSRSQPIAPALYGLLVVGALESVRYSYFSQARFLVALIGCYLILVVAKNFSRPLSGK